MDKIQTDEEELSDLKFAECVVQTTEGVKSMEHQ